MSNTDTTYRELRRFNMQAVDIINAAWGANVAWVEDHAYPLVSGGATLVPRIASKLVNGKLPGRTTVPRFFAGPATGRIK